MCRVRVGASWCGGHLIGRPPVSGFVVGATADAMAIRVQFAMVVRVVGVDDEHALRRRHACRLAQEEGGGSELFYLPAMQLLSRPIRGRHLALVNTHRSGGDPPPPSCLALVQSQMLSATEILDEVGPLTRRLVVWFAPCAHGRWWGSERFAAVRNEFRDAAKRAKMQSKWQEKLMRVRNAMDIRAGGLPGFVMSK